MQNQLAIGVDLGGTKIAFVLVDEQGAVRASHQLPTAVNDGVEAVIDRIAHGIQQAGYPVIGIGIGSPGHLNPLTGVVHNAVNLGWREVPLVAALQRRLSGNVPIWLQKDTNAALLGELYFGAARDVQDVVLVAIGTGLGVGAVIGGRIVLGANYFATDVGHLSLDPSGRQCACGLRGCIEMYVSGIGIIAGVHEHRAYYPHSKLAQIESPTTDAILKAARDGDPLANVVLNEAADWLGMAFAQCAVVLNPALFVISGGLGLAAADLLLERAEREFRRRVSLPVYQNLRFVQSQITVSAIGAACLVWHALK